jgi:hypothetical protein
MRKLLLLSRTLTLCSLFVTLSGAALAGPVYRWTGADGSVSFTDDPKRIPAQHREEARRVSSGSLAGYARYTPAESRAARNARSERLAERLERLRALNEPAFALAPGANAAGGETIVRLDDRTSITIPNHRLLSSEPVVVEERRVRDRNNISTIHVTVVRQGDQILSVVRPESAHDRADWIDETDLFEAAEEE